MAEIIGWGSLPNVPRIMVEFTGGRPEVIALMGGDWRHAAARKAAAERRLGHLQRPGLGSALRQGYGGRQLPELVERNLQALDRDDTLAIVTGQQVGVLGGPLFTFYKALSAIMFAEALEPHAPGAVVPIFWMETADADFGEVNRISFPPDGDIPRRVAYNPADLVSGRSVSFHRLQAEINPVLDEVRSWLQTQLNGAELGDLIAKSYMSGRLLADGFRDLMTELLGKWGLVMLDPQTPGLSLRATEFWERCLERPQRLNQSFAMASRELETMRLPLQVKMREDALPIMFLDEEGIRRRIHGTPEGWNIGKDGPAITVGEMLRVARERPGALTPSALLRPLLQDWLLPTLAYVGGPAEISYQAQIGHAYDFLEIPRPLIAPRASLTLVERPMRRLLDKHGWKVMDVLGGRELLLGRHGHSQSLMEQFDHGSEQLKGWLERIERASDEAGINITAEVDQAGRKLGYQWEKLARIAKTKVENRDHTRLSHARLLCDGLMPDGMLQERHDNVLYYLAGYGDKLIESIRTDVDLFHSNHLAIDLEPVV